MKNMTSFQIRPATEKDRELIFTISTSVEITKTWQMDQFTEDGALNTRFREVPLPRPMRLNYPSSPKVIGENLEKNDLNLIAEKDGKISGFLSLFAGNGSSIARVTDLAVAEEDRNLGAATLLMINAVEWLQVRGAKEIILEMMLKNTPGINFSRQLGFHFCGFHDVYYPNGQTAIFFNRQVI